MDDIQHKLAERIDAEFYRILLGGHSQRQTQTALRVRGGMIETVELDDSGNVIEPCRKCGPILLCSACMARVT